MTHMIVCGGRQEGGGYALASAVKKILLGVRGSPFGGPYTSHIDMSHIDHIHKGRCNTGVTYKAGLHNDGR